MSLRRGRLPAWALLPFVALLTGCGEPTPDRRGPGPPPLVDVTAATVPIDKRVENLPDLTVEEIETILAIARKANPGVAVRKITYSRSHPLEIPYVSVAFAHHEVAARIRRYRRVSLDAVMTHHPETFMRELTPPGERWVADDLELEIDTEVCTLGHSFLSGSPVPPSEVVALGVGPDIGDDELLDIFDAMRPHVPEGERIWSIAKERWRPARAPLTGFEIMTIDATRKRGLHGSVFRATWGGRKWTIERTGSWVS